MLNSVCYRIFKQQLFTHPRGDSESVLGVVQCEPTSLGSLIGMLGGLSGKVCGQSLEQMLGILIVIEQLMTLPIKRFRDREKGRDQWIGQKINK